MAAVEHALWYRHGAPTLDRDADPTPCVQRSDLFDPARSGEVKKARVRSTEQVPRIAAALALCRSCPVLVECRRNVYRSTDPWAHGVRGGRYVTATDAAELAKLNRDLRAAS